MPTICLLLFLAGLLFSNINCIDDSANKGNVENLKILRSSVNFAYKAGNNFLDLIRGSTPPHKPLQHVFSVISSKDGFKLSDFLPIYKPYIGYICLMIIGLLFVIFMPIVGLCFCCCRCCGKCGGRIKGMDPKRATCKRYTYALCLGIISIIKLAGIVLAFINNQLIHETLTNPSVEISAVKQITSGFNLLQSSLQNISEAIKNAEQSPIGGSDSGISDGDLLENSCQEFMRMLNNANNRQTIIEGLYKISQDLDAAVGKMKEIRQDNEKLKDYAKKLKAMFLELQIDKIQPQVCTILSNEIKSDLKNFRQLIQDQSKSGQSTRSKLQEIVSFFNSTLESVSIQFSQSMDGFAKLEFLEYRMYISIGVCCLLLLIVLFYFLGLCFGQCGERPFEDARICNRGVGANLLMAGVAFAFIFTWIIMLFEIHFFMYGGMTQTELCRYVSDIDKPMVGPLDSVLQAFPHLKNNVYVKNNILDSIFNKCSSESMPMAFNIDNHLMTEDVITKISEIGGKAGNALKARSSNVTDNYFGTLEYLLTNIKNEVNQSKINFEGYDVETRETMNKLLNAVLKSIDAFSLATVKDKFKNSFVNIATTGFENILLSEVKKELARVFLSRYSSVKCDGIYHSARKVADAFCVTFLWPFNGLWYGIGICLLFTIPGIIFAVKLVGLYRRTEKYSADYEEPDYHSYMGFYTNNADNIPMKRPKSAKSNSKNRNSNSNNNKDSVKQNNPQYLPVYPYDAYE